MWVKNRQIWFCTILSLFIQQLIMEFLAVNIIVAFTGFGRHTDKNYLHKSVKEKCQNHFQCFSIVGAFFNNFAKVLCVGLL